MLVALMMLLAGCEAGERSTFVTRQGWSSRGIDNATAAQVMDAARYALGQWFTVSETRPSEGLVLAAPSEFDERGGTGRLRDAAIGYRNRVRRRAAVRIRSAARGVTVECIVIKERLDTSDHRVFAMNRQFEDVPNQTPIAGEGATSSSQNEVWSDVGRDRTLERDILAALLERLGGPARETAPTSTAPA